MQRSDDEISQPAAHERADAADELHRLNAQLASVTAELRRVEAELHQAEVAYTLVCEGVQDAVWDWDIPGGKVRYSPRYRAMFGLPAHSIAEGTSVGWERIHPDDRAKASAAITEHLRGKTTEVECDLRAFHINGQPLWLHCRALAARDASGRAIRIAGSITDLAGRRNAEENAKRAIRHDALTGLPNRVALLARLERCIRRARRDLGVRYAALHLDIDRFKRINDGLGHGAGDELIRAFAERVLHTVRATDTLTRSGPDPLTRLGSDEFVLVLEDFRGDSTALRVAERLLSAMAAPFSLLGRDVYVTCCIGIVISSAKYATAEEVLRDTDLALHHAKSHGRGRFEVFDAAVHANTLLRWQLEGDMRAALGTGAFFLEYQPVVCLRTRRVKSVEALVRWNHPRFGRIPPGDFIPLAEETGMVIQLGLEVFAMAARDLRTWREHHPNLADLHIAVNVSPRQLAGGGLTEAFVEVLAEHDLPASLFHVEITESVLMDPHGSSLAELERLRALGMRLHLDDFGTGYCSLGYLRRIPVDALKIDRSFVIALDDGDATSLIVHSIVTLAKGLGTEVIAEGVETTDQLARVTALGCDYVQGHVFHAAMSSPDLIDWVTDPILFPESSPR